MKHVSNHYFYEGPVYIFGSMVKENWVAETYATSEKKAKCNFEYQYKRLHGYTSNAAIRVDPKLIGIAYE